VETHELPTYALALAKGGHKLSPPSDIPGPIFGFSGGAGGPRITARNAPITMLTDRLFRQLDRVAIDDTGLSGGGARLFRLPTRSAGLAVVKAEPMPGCTIKGRGGCRATMEEKTAAQDLGDRTPKAESLQFLRVMLKSIVTVTDDRGGDDDAT